MGMGQKARIDDTEYYEALLKQAREDANRLHGDIEEEWEEQKYMKRLQRIYGSDTMFSWYRCWIFKERRLQ